MGNDAPCLYELESSIGCLSDVSQKYRPIYGVSLRCLSDVSRNLSRIFGFNEYVSRCLSELRPYFFEWLSLPRAEACPHGASSEVRGGNRSAKSVLETEEAKGKKSWVQKAAIQKERGRLAGLDGDNVDTD